MDLGLDLDLGVDLDLDQKNTKFLGVLVLLLKR